MGDVLAMATPPSAFQQQNSAATFVPSFNYPIKLSDYESSLQNLDYAKLLSVKNPEPELAIILNHQNVETVEEDILYDPIYEALRKENGTYEETDEIEDFSPEAELPCVEKINITDEKGQTEDVIEGKIH